MGEGSYFNRLARLDLLGKGTFEQRLEGGAAVGHWRNLWGRILGRAEARGRSVSGALETSKEASMAEENVHTLWPSNSNSRILQHYLIYNIVCILYTETLYKVKFISRVLVK